MIRALSILVLALAPGLGLASRSAAQTQAATFALDALSFVSFEDSEVYPIPPGGAILFRFGAPNPDGSLPFTIAPADARIPTIPLDGGRTLTYRLTQTTQGVVARDGEGLKVVFSASIAADLASPDGKGGTRQYAMQFTTETATASNLARTKTVAVEGMPLQATAGAMQLVGAATSQEGAYPGPGAAAYTVLSGRFDRLPDLP